MNEALAAFLGRDAEERRDIFDACAERLDTRPTYIEKDFWVCHVLDALYNGRAADQPRLVQYARRCQGDKCSRAG